MAYDFNTVKVLIVDNEPAIGELIRQVICGFGAIAHHETNGKEAIRHFNRVNPDLVIIDWDVEGMSGIDLTKAFRNNDKNPYVPIIFMAAFSSKERVTEARDAGITEFLKKPFSAESIYQRIERVVEMPRPFIRSREFFGPDRRKKSKELFTGTDLRQHTPKLEKIVDPEGSARKARLRRLGTKQETY